ncbi:MAG: hypothetical protein RIT02_3241 [Planctomycetota bacterium]|jgi:hypothetical protein
MSETAPSETPGVLPATPPITEPQTPELPDRIYLVSYPKIVFMYPTMLTSLICSIVMLVYGGIPASETRTQLSQAQPRFLLASVDIGKAGTDGSTTPATKEQTAPAVAAPTYHLWCARIFLAVLTLNLVVLSFEFPRTTSLTWFFALSTAAIGLWFLFTMYENLAPAVLQSLLAIKPAANAAFYMIFTGILLLLFVAVLISRRVDYWEVRGNELLHHHGLLSNLERFSAPNLRIDKEITDLFEYLLLRSGRLIIHCSNERRAIVLENVLNIDHKERQITRLLGALQVRVRPEKE